MYITQTGGLENQSVFFLENFDYNLLLLFTLASLSNFSFVIYVVFSIHVYFAYEWRIITPCVKLEEAVGFPALSPSPCASCVRLAGQVSPR